MTTKQKITGSALFLFNRFGVVNVRLQHIADETGLSVGNLAYHFRTKDDLVEALYEQIIAEQQQLLAGLRMIPLFANLDQHLHDTWQMQQRYSFFFTDTLEIMRAYPGIKRKHREHISWQKIQYQLFLEFNVARGALRMPEGPDSVEQLAHRYVLLTDTWLSYEVMQGVALKDVAEDAFKAAVWSLWAPYFTATGRHEYEQMKQLPFDNFS